LVVNGDEGMEPLLAVTGATFAAQSGPRSRQVIVKNRDHMTIVSDLAVTGDRGRAEVLDFLRQHIVPSP
jgi:hypothetical protein